MNKQTAVDYFGSARALAKALDISEGAVSQWESIPILRQYQLEVLTGGKLQADRQTLKQTA